MSWCNPENNSALLFFKMDEVNILKGYNRSGILTELLLSGSWKLQLDKERGWSMNIRARCGFTEAETKQQQKVQGVILLFQK